MIRKLMTAVLGGLTALTMFAAPAQAAPATAEVAAADVQCWTTFEPPAPRGGPMTQYYKNCNNFTIGVATGFTEGSGQINVFVTTCQAVSPGQTISWFYSATNAVNYKTVICDPSSFVPQAVPASPDPCWTSFSPSNPNGGPMVHRYKNCNNHGVTVTTGRSDASGQILVFSNSCAGASPGGGIRWNYGSTAAGWNYHTIVCLF